MNAISSCSETKIENVNFLVKAKIILISCVLLEIQKVILSFTLLFYGLLLFCKRPEVTNVIFSYRKMPYEHSTQYSEVTCST